MRAQRASAPPRTLVLLRHGRTAWNDAGRIQGHADAELDETGHAQARAVARHVAALRPVHLWSSDLSRAATTASYVGQACGLEPVTDARLREYSLGSREGWTHDDYAVRHPEEFAAFRTGDFDVVPDGEGTIAVEKRMRAALDDLIAVTPEGGLSVAVSHGAALRVVIASLLSWDVEQLRTLGALDNCGWSVLTELPVGGGFRLSAYNRVAQP